jgi:solute carrier family 35, member E1
MAGWFVTSLASLFCAKHILHNYPVNEAVFTLSQFTSSVLIGLAFTKVLRLHPLASLSAAQLRAVLPLAAAFLVKEMLKYMAIARVSVNLVNTVRSLGPLFSIALERVALRHSPPRAVVLSIIPTIIGVALTSYDEMNATSSAGLSFVVFLVGLSAAVVSTAINQSQNIYSKILFGQERIDPVSLQIYLSAMSLAIMAPYTIVHSLYEYTALSASVSSHFTFAPPSLHVAGILFGAGFINFLSSQLAFSTLALISPVSYSVANTFKRVCIAVIAIAVFGEHLSPVNGIGIAVSIAGVFAYEKASRDYKQSKLYRSAPKSPNASDAALPDLHTLDNSETKWTNGKEYSGVPSDPNSVVDVTSHQLGGLPHDRQSYLVQVHNPK